MSMIKFIQSTSNRTNNLCVAQAIGLRQAEVRNVTTDLKRLPIMPNCKYKPSTYNGISYEEIKKAHESVVSPSLKTSYKQPLLLHEGRGQWLWDHNGKRYLDMFAGVATVAVGHSHPKIVAAMSEQASKLNHVTSLYMHPRLYEYVKKLSAKFSDKLKVVYLTNSGSEANELAFIMSRLYTHRHNIISLRNCYHGGTYTAISATAMGVTKFPMPQVPGHVHATCPDVYRGFWGGAKCRDSPVQVVGRPCECMGEQCTASDNYVHDFKNIFDFSFSKTENVAAFIAESIQGVGGVVQYPKSFLKKVCDCVHQNGGLFIADEVQTGFARTGEHFWGFESYDVEPDIVTMAKGIGNGFPLGAVITSAEIAASLNSTFHFNTFGGNPIACSVGSAVLDIIEEEGLQKNAHIVGTYLLNRLSNLLSDFPNIVGDVRGKGLLIGVELVSNPETRQHLEKERMADIFEDIKDMGVLVGKGGICGNILRIKPPLCVTKEDADFTFEIIRKALEKHQDKYFTSKS